MCRVNKVVMNTVGFGVADKRLDGHIVESVVSLATISKFLCMMAVSCLPMSEKGVIMGRMLVSECGARWDSR